MAKAAQLPRLYDMERTVEGSRNPPLAASDGADGESCQKRCRGTCEQNRNLPPAQCVSVVLSRGCSGAAFRVRAGFSVFTTIQFCTVAWTSIRNIE